MYNKGKKDGGTRFFPLSYWIVIDVHKNVDITSENLQLQIWKLSC